MPQFVVVSYDIPEDRRRTKVMKTLKNYGAHVQYSVFECQLEETELRSLRRKLVKLVQQGDSIRLYFIGRDDVQRIEVLGGGRASVERRIFLY